MNTLKFILAIGMFVTLTGLPKLSFGQSYSIDFLNGEGGVQGIKFAVQKHTNILDKLSPRFSLYYEASINALTDNAADDRESQAFIALSPVVQYRMGQVFARELSLEFGIGISLFSDTLFARKNIGSHYQFEDRIGLLLTLNKARKDRLALRYFHYSNAGLQRPNPGLDFISLSYLREF